VRALARVGRAPVTSSGETNVRRSAKLLILVGTLAAAGVGCSTIDLAGPGDPAPRTSESAVPFQRMRDDSMPLTSNSGLADAQRRVIRDEVTWASVWEAIWRNHTPLPPLPQIDFGREMLVVASTGIKPSGGYAIVVEGVEEVGGVLQVKLLSTSPHDRCFVTAAITHPVDVARIPASTREVRFTERRTVTQCR
jgi:hypothetical protein